MLDGQLDCLLLCIVEDDASEGGTGGIVHVDDGMFAACDSIDGAPNEVLTGWS